MITSQYWIKPTLL